MEMIDRYIYATIRRLPPKQRKEAELDLRKRIQEMLQEQVPGEDPSGKDILAVLERLGNPDKMAEKYRGSPRYLIGPVLFETYWLVLRIVLIAAGIGLVIATIIQVLTEQQATAWQVLINIFSNIYQGLLGVFAMVTLVFALIEYFNIDTSSLAAADTSVSWHPSSLPAVPGTGLRIKRSDPIFTIMFTLLFLAIINIYPELFGYYNQTDTGLQIIPALSNELQRHLLWINLVLILAVILESIKIVTGRWTLALVGSCIIQNMLSLIVSLRVLRQPGLVNSDFIEAVTNLFNRGNVSISQNWPQYMLTTLTVLVIIGFVVDTLATGAKGIRLVLAGNNDAK